MLQITASYRTAFTLVTALVNRPVIFLQMLAARAVDVGASSLITVFKPNINHSHAHSVVLSDSCATFHHHVLAVRYSTSCLKPTANKSLWCVQELQDIVLYSIIVILNFTPALQLDCMMHNITIPTMSLRIVC